MSRTRVAVVLVAAAVSFAAGLATVATTLNDFFLSGSQPLQSGTITKDCGSCHGGFSHEPDFNWAGGMMAHAARDPIWQASMAIAEQDAAFSGDLCIRCHSPKAWLEGRSTPTDGSLITAADRESVQCEFCHRLVRPFAKGTNPYASNSTYTATTFPYDTTYLGKLTSRVTHIGDGMFAVDSDPIRRGPRTLSEVNPNHPGGVKAHYSPFHREAALCGTCHDVSNPVFNRVIGGDGKSTYVLNALDTPPPSMSPHSQFPVERTYSEWTVSAYNSVQGIYAPQFGGTKQYVSTCQDCHMRDVAARFAASGSDRTDAALHDQTGGNTFMPALVKAKYPSEVIAAALDSGVARARGMLRKAATLEVLEELPNIRVRVTNETGHKLPSGYPEGRRMWLNVQFLDGDSALLSEHGAYDALTATLVKTTTKVYEVKLGMSPEIVAATGKSNDVDSSSFHFVLNNVVVMDNRIPPRGFTNAAFDSIQSPPVAATYADGQYWDETVFAVPSGTVHYVVGLYYQTTSKEYAEFLRDENTTNNLGNEFYTAWSANGKSTPELMARVTSQHPLPVTLVSYEASVLQSTVRLTWRTETEQENFGYDVERRVVGIRGNESDWSTIGFVAGAGTSNIPHEYAFQDEDIPPGRYAYRLKQIDRSGAFKYSYTVEVEVGSMPIAFALDQNYPNPFNPATTIRFSLPVRSHVRLDIVSLDGRIVETLVDGELSASAHSIVWFPNVSSGLYLYRLDAVSSTDPTVRFSNSRKMVLIR